MYYQAGDFYRGGGYYAAGGDYKAGGLFSFVKKVAGSALKVGVGAVGGMISGGPLGAIRGAAKGALSAVRSNVVADFNAAQVGTGQAAMTAARAAAVPGMAMVKAPRAPKVSGRGAGGFYGGRKRMNTLNPKALSRATRRIKGFEQHAKKSLRVLGLHVVRHVTRAPVKSGRR